MTAMIDSLTIYQNAIDRKTGCLFCKPVEGMIYHETKNFTVLLDTFPIVPGHLMISSKNHYGCAGEIPIEIFNELKNLKNSLKEKMKSISSSVIFYEHGKAGCCMNFNPEKDRCEHFHLHCLPSKVSIKEKLKKNFKLLKLEKYENINPYFYEKGDYLYFEESNGTKSFFYVENKEVKSHLLRTLICNSLNVSHRANWQEFDEGLVFVESHELIQKFIKF